MKKCSECGKDIDIKIKDKNTLKRFKFMCRECGKKCLDNIIEKYKQETIESENHKEVNHEKKPEAFC